MSATKETASTGPVRVLKFNSVKSNTSDITTSSTPQGLPPPERPVNTYHVDSFINNNILHLAHLNEGSAFFA